MLQIAAGSAVAWQVTRVNGTLTITPQTMAITSVVSAAGYGSALSAGQIVSIFGAGFTAGTAQPKVTIKGQAVEVIAAFPFQVNAILPAGIATGNASVAMSGTLGTASLNVTILGSAPGIFGLVNQDGTLNSASNPAARGAYVSIYGTGLGGSGGPVPGVTIGTLYVKPSYAGPAPGFTGLFQINVQIPASIAPGSDVSLSVTQTVTSNTVAVAIE
jgi:uncharacterized protein (TIGR03437 family)